MQWHNGLLWAWNSALNPDILQAYLLYQQKMQRLSGSATLRIWAMFCAVSFSWKPGGILSTGVPMGRPGAQCSVHNRLSWMYTVTTMRTMRNTSIVILNDELWSTRSCDCIDESSHSPKSCASDAAKPAGAWEFANRTVAALLPSWLLYPMTLQVILVLRETGHCKHVDLQIRDGHSHTIAERLCFITNLCPEIEDLKWKRDFKQRSNRYKLCTSTRCQH